MAVTNSELENLLPSRIFPKTYESFQNQSFYFSKPSAPELEENFSRQQASLEADKRAQASQSGSSLPTTSHRVCSFRGIWRTVNTPRVKLYVTRFFTLVCLALLVWGNTFFIAGKEAGPDGQLFWIGVLGISAYLAGALVQSIGLPPLLGMLIMGIVLRNTRSVEIKGPYLVLAADIRMVALVIILIRAGLGLDPTALKRLSGMVIRLAIFPSLVEASSMAVMSHCLLGLPWIWCILLGAVMAAVSPAVVIPCLFSLQERGYGTYKGIPTLVIAAATFDDVIAISVFSVALSIIFSTGNLIRSIIQGPLGLIFGFCFGILWGLLIRYVPNRHDRFLVLLRTLLLGGGGLLLLFGSEAVGFAGAGPLGCVIAAFVANRGWRAQGWTGETNPVTENYAVMWTVFQPLLFGIIGNEIDFDMLDLSIVGLGAGCLAVSLSARILITAIVAFGGNLTVKEKLFVSWAWFPKATVQAAIGPVALDVAREVHSAEYESYASRVLIIAVLAILITAPVGATFITVLGPRLLDKEPTATPESNTVPSNQNNGRGGSSAH